MFGNLSLKTELLDKLDVHSLGPSVATNKLDMISL